MRRNRQKDDRRIFGTRRMVDVVESPLRSRREDVRTALFVIDEWLKRCIHVSIRDKDSGTPNFPGSFRSVEDGTTTNQASSPRI
mmetsp:Transcript_7746/g.20934  ORF Transcript_7746/g.20934 Transcript_7746/m.20934 type:complete len:84 (-) Transcript_7746:289-540(-)